MRTRARLGMALIIEYGFASNAKGDEKKEFENKHSDKAFRCEQLTQTTSILRRARTSAYLTELKVQPLSTLNKP